MLFYSGTALIVGGHRNAPSCCRQTGTVNIRPDAHTAGGTVRLSEFSGVVVFKQDSCGACAQYLPIFQQVRARHPKVRAVIVDAPQNNRAADFYRVRYTPTTLALKQGKVLRRIDGASGPPAVESIFRAAG